MTLTLNQVSIPAGSTIGCGLGVDERGCRVRFASDWRPLRDLGEALAVMAAPIEVEVADSRVLSIEEVAS